MLPDSAQLAEFKRLWQEARICAQTHDEFVQLKNISKETSYRIVAAHDKTPAKWEGHFSCEKKAGAFEASGKCYKCESGYQRNLLSTKCVAPAYEDLKATSASKSATGLIKTDCPKGYFLHQLSGTCYQCPAGYNRTGLMYAFRSKTNSTTSKKNSWRSITRLSIHSYSVG